MRRKLWAFALLLAVLALPFAAAWIYHTLTAYPQQIRIAAGPEGGRYLVLATRLKEAIEAELDVQVEVLETDGSLDNLERLRDGLADLALFQRSADLMSALAPRDARQIKGVANLYSEVCHAIARPGSGVATLDDLRGRRVAVPIPSSGDYAIARLVLNEYGLNQVGVNQAGAAVQPAVDERPMPYTAMKRAFADGTVDAAIITMGVEAPLCQELLVSAQGRLLTLPRTEVLSARHLALTSHVIPQGMYRLAAPSVPPRDVPTVSLRAQLLARADLPTGLVEAVTGLVLREDFLQANHLVELARGGADFAREKLEFPPHRGALNHFEPELRPWLNPDFVDSTEGLRSLVVSVIIAVFLGVRWVTRRRVRSQEHKLDRFIRQLLDIEQRQLSLDQSEGWADLETLQTLLDEVAGLRHQALRQFSAHELNEDRAVDCLLELCQALTEKINAKISRQRLDKRFAELGAAVRQGGSQGGV